MLKIFQFLRIRPCLKKNIPAKYLPFWVISYLYGNILRDPDNNQIVANNVTSFSQWAFASEAGDNSLLNNRTTIRYAVPQPTRVEISIFSVLGEQLKTWKNDVSAGYHVINWYGTNQAGREVSSGIYFYRIKTDNFLQAKKLILSK